MASAQDITTLELDRLLEQSRPRGGHPGALMLFIAMGLLLVLLVPGGRGWVEPLIPLIFAGLLLFAVWHTTRLARMQREENDHLRLADESLRLGVHARAAHHLGELLGRPARRAHVRIQALLYLGGLLTRQGRYSDVIRLFDHLQEQAQFPPPVALSLRCMRAYAMLRDDRIADSYQAVSELKRDYPAGSGMLTVLEMYRLVKLGHHADALELFAQRRTQLTEQLAHRSCDAWALAAAAALATGQESLSASYARSARLLGDAEEIVLRYPECAAALRVSAGGRP